MEPGELYPYTGPKTVKRKSFFLFLVFLLAASACSIEIDTTPVPLETKATPLPGISILDKLRVKWSGLSLTGKLLYNTVDSSQTTLEIQMLDLTTGDRQLIFRLPERSWCDAAVVSPDGKTIVIGYSPPPTDLYGEQESLYTISLDSPSPPELIVVPDSRYDNFSQPQWSPDGKELFFAHVNYDTMENYEIMHMAYPSGKPETLIDHAYWPRVSLDGTLLVYVSLEPNTGVNHLFIANRDGSNARRIQVQGLPIPQVIDAPMISPDNKFILFSSPDGYQVFEPNWFDKLLGVQTALADGTLPSDWWSVPISGGKATRLTHIRSLALFGMYSPDQQYVASFSSSGIFVMKPDGRKLTMIVKDVGGIVGTVHWLP